jgi:hypothetical protein
MVIAKIDHGVFMVYASVMIPEYCNIAAKSLECHTTPDGWRHIMQYRLRFVAASAIIVIRITLARLPNILLTAENGERHTETVEFLTTSAANMLCLSSLSLPLQS